MPTLRAATLFRIGSALALALVMAACTKGGQFDPTEIMNSDMLDTKKKLQGQREPVFPEGVPGVVNGVPPELVKGYQPPVEPPPPSQAEAAKPAPKPKVARLPPKTATPAGPRTRISVGATGQPGTSGQQQTPAATAQQQPPPAQANWPMPGQQATQPAQQNWPTPPATPPAAAQPAWPAPPPTR